MGRTVHIAMHDYELDSLCSFIKLSYKYWKFSGIHSIFEEIWLSAVKQIISVWKLEQNHLLSNYSYPLLEHAGRGSAVCYTGMTWSGFRPSDDKCKYNYLIPANMFAVVCLGYLEEILLNFYRHETPFLREVKALKQDIDDGIHSFGVVTIERRKIYVYETDGCGNFTLMDDANLPSLLSIDYLEYRSSHDPEHIIANNTRSFVLSPDNPYFFNGTYGKGIGLYLFFRFSSFLH